LTPAWRRAWLDAKALALPLGVYWTSLLFGLAMFSAIVFTTQAWTTETTAAVTGIWIAAVGGVALGQALTLLRLRGAVALALMAGVFGLLYTLTASALFVPSVAAGPMLGIVVVIVLFLAPWFVASGHFSLSTNGGMFATLAPIVFIVGSILLVSEDTGSLARWQAGDKWAVWNVFTALILGAGVVLVLVFLASREIHRLHRWRYNPAGPDLAQGASQEGLAPGRAMPGWGGLLVLLALGAFLTVGSAFVAPYLWRTGDGDNGSDASADSQSSGRGGGSSAEDGGRDGQRGTSGHQGGDASDGQGVGGEHLSEQARRAAEQASFSLLMLMAMLLLALLSLLVFGPPLRRMFLLQHLRHPFWPVPPTRRVRQHWRLVEIALGDLGHTRHPGDSATSLARRAVGRVDMVDPESLLRCAEIADRVSYGLSVQPQDTMLARRTAEMTYQTVWEELTEAQKFRAMYRLL
jgi:hypothetical protein